MARSIIYKNAEDPNGTWTRVVGVPPFNIPVEGGVTYDVETDTGEVFSLTPTLGEVADIITAFEVTDGEPHDTVSVTSSDVGTLFLGAYPAGTLAEDINPAALEAGDDTGQIEVIEAGNSTVSGLELVFQNIDSEISRPYVIAAVVKLGDGSYSEVETRPFMSNPVVAPSGPTVEVFEPFSRADVGENPKMYSYDLSGYAAGDKIYIPSGSSEYDVEATIDGVQMAEITRAVGNGGAKAVVWGLTLTQAGLANSEIRITGTAGWPQNGVLIGVKGGSLVEFAGAGNQAANPPVMTFPLAIPDAPNVVMGVAIGKDEVFSGDPVSWSIPDLHYRVFGAVTEDPASGISVARQDDLPAGNYDLTFTQPQENITNGSRVAVMALRFS